MRDSLGDLIARLGAALKAGGRALGAALDPYLAPVRARYRRLEPREKLLVRIAAAVIALFILYDVVYLPIRNMRTGLRDRIEARRRDVTEVQRLAMTYSTLKRSLAVLEKKTVPGSRGFSLFSVLEQSLSSSVGHDKIVSITPGINRQVSTQLTQYSVDLKLSNLSLGQVVDTLYAIQSLKVPVVVSNLHIKRRTPDTRAYDVDLICVALGRAGR